MEEARKGAGIGSREGRLEEEGFVGGDGEAEV